MANFDAKELNIARGVGKCPRIEISHEYLTSLGWKIRNSGKSFRYESPEGKVLWSNKAVAQYLNISIPESEKNEAEKRPFADVSDSDPEYIPVSASEEEYFSSPEKREVGLPISVHKRYVKFINNLDFPRAQIESFRFIISLDLLSLAKFFFFQTRFKRNIGAAIELPEMEKPQKQIGTVC